MREFNLTFDESFFFHYTIRDTLCGCGCFAGWEATSREVLVYEGVLFVPAVSEPELKFLRRVEGHIRYGKAAPVHVYGRRWLPLKIHGAEGEEVLAEFSSPTQISTNQFKKGYVNLLDTFVD